ncbi:MAG: hypothetical protein K0U84_01810 [Actinomycetia bacterium]|nr:hypothetical protein [Actinomycetes bacterium]
MNWSRPDTAGAITAVGGKGHYSITWDNGYILNGFDHHGLPMLALPRVFTTLERAKARAEALERVTTKEPEASGT